LRIEVSENGTGFLWQRAIWVVGRGRRVGRGGWTVAGRGVTGGIRDRVEAVDGRGIVRREGGAQQEQILEGAPIDVVVAGLIAAEEGEAAGIVRVLEGAGEGGDSVAGVGDVEATVEELGFEAPGAAHAPLCGDHFFDDAVLNSVGRAEALQVVDETLFEARGGFATEEDDFGDQAVAEGVLRGDLLAGVRDRAVGASAIGAGRLDSAKGRHR